MGWVWMDHPDLPGGPERFPDDPDVVAVQEARGWEYVDDPEQVVVEPVEPDEVDIHGQGWVWLIHPDLSDRPLRFPVEAVSALREQGWDTRAALEAAAKKKAASKKPSPVVGDDSPKEK